MIVIFLPFDFNLADMTLGDSGSHAIIAFGASGESKYKPLSVCMILVLMSRVCDGFF